MIGTFTSNRRAHGNVLVVAVDGTGDFDNIKDAVESITDNAEDNPWLIDVLAGEFVEDPFTLKPYVTIQGHGLLATSIKTSDPGAHFLTGVPAACLRELSVHGPTDPGMAAVDFTGTGSIPMLLQEVAIAEGDIGVYVHPASSGLVHCIMTVNHYAGSAMSDFIRVESAGRVVALNSGYMSGPPGSLTGSSFSVSGASAYLALDTCFVRAPGSTNGLLVDGGAFARAQATTFNGTTNALNVGPTGASELRVTGCYMGSTHTRDVWVQSGTAKVSISGSAIDKSKVTAHSSANFSASFADSTPGEEGVVNIGELWLGTLTEAFPLGTYARTTASTGWESGGGVSFGANPLDIDVAAGSGFVKTATGLIRVAWGAQTVSVSADTDLGYIVVNSSGVASAVTLVNYSTHVVLAGFSTNGSEVVALSSEFVPMPNADRAHHLYLQEVIGPVAVSGLVVTETTPLQLTVGSGAFYAANNRLTVAGGSDVAFTEWYRDGSGGWTKIPGVTQVSTTLYDDSSGTLAALPATKFRRDLVYVTVNSASEEYHLVYGQEVFDTANDALNGNNPSSPDMLSTTGCRLAAVTVEQGALALTNAIDQRPFIGSNASSVTSSSDHGNLSGLVDDDHPQYHTEARADTWFGTKLLGDLFDVDAADGPPDDKILLFDGAVWEGTAELSATNVNVGGQGLFKQKDNRLLELRGINAGSEKIVVGLDDPNNEVTIDLGTVSHTDIDFTGFTPALNLDDLNDVTISIPAAEGLVGFSLAYSGTEWREAYSPFTIECARSAPATNIWLRGADGTPHNVSPVRLAYNSKLIAMSAVTDAASTCTIELHAGTAVRTGGVPSAASKIAELSLVAASSVAAGFAANIASVTDLGVFCRGTAVDNPRVTLYFVLVPSSLQET